MDIKFAEPIEMENEQGSEAPAAISGADSEPEREIPAKMLFTLNGDDYELVYTKIRIRHIEDRADKGIASVLARIEIGDPPKLSEIYRLFAGGFKKVGGGYVSFEQGEKIAEEVIEEYGYLKMIQYIVYALERDCPFLFRVS